MSAVRITLATLSNLAGQPLAWLAVAALLFSGPALAFAAPLAISSISLRESAWLYELAFMGMLVGSMLATTAVHRLSSVISFALPRSGLASQMLSLTSVGLLLGLITTLPAILLGGFRSDLLSGGLVLRFVLGVATTAAFGCILLRMRLPAGVLPWLLCALILLAPLSLPQPLPVRSLATVAAALLSAAWLLDHPPGRTP